MKKKNYLVILFLFFGIHAYTQLKQLLHKDYKNRVEATDNLYDWVRKTQDSTAVLNLIDRLAKLAKNNHDSELVIEAKLLRAYYYREYYTDNHKEVLKRLTAIARKGKKENLVHIEARAVKMIAGHYWWKIKDKKKAFVWLLRLEKVLKTTTSEEFPDMAEYYNIIGYYYYYFSDYKKAIVYFKKVTSFTITAYNGIEFIEAKNNLGLSYQKLGCFALSDSYFLFIINDTSKFSTPVWKGIASGNLGYNYYLRDDYQKAILWLARDVQTALEHEYFGLAAGSSTTLADIYLKQGELEKADRKIEQVRKYIAISGQTDRLRLLYPIMGKWFAKMGLPDSSAVYMDSSVAALKLYNQKFNALKLLRANKQVRTKQREVELQKWKNLKQEKIGRWNLFLFFLIMLILLASFTYYLQVRKIRKQKQLQVQRIREAVKELKTAKVQLHNFMREISEKNRLITTLQKKNNTVNHDHVVGQLRESVILTEKDWKEFSQIFKKVFPGFQNHLKEKNPRLTPAEIRCLSLLKLNLSNKEMASMQGISENAVVVTRHRIRKKLHFDRQEEVGELVRGL